MRYLMGLVCVLAVGVTSVMGCSETEGGQGGDGGTGGMPECISSDACDDENECTDDSCEMPSGLCQNTPVDDGTLCSAGVCRAGACVAAFACTEPGIREAIAAGGGPRYFACEGRTIVTTGAQITIRNDVILDGLGNLIVDGNDDHRVFSVAAGITAELRGFTVSGGLVAGLDGGGIYNGRTATLTLTNSTVSDNTAGSAGGGIYNDGAATLTLTNSTVSGNTARLDGGGIYNDGTATLTLTNSTVSDNTAGFRGGGIWSSNTELTLTNSTVSGNVARRGGGGIRVIRLTAGTSTAKLTNITVSDNTAEDFDGVAGPAELTNSLVDGDCAADVISGGYNNIESGDTCGFILSNADLRLGPLQDNGGPTETHLLLPGSAAIDQIPEADCQVAEDQRGEPRPAGPDPKRCDIGAVEVQ